MDIKVEKKELRKLVRELKKSASGLQMAKESAWLVRQICELDLFRSANTVFAYWPMQDEVDIRPLIKEWYGLKRFVLPKIVGDQLELRCFEGEDKLVVGPHFGILEPAGEFFTDFESIDLAIVPGAAFDNLGHRMGHGKGYYDRLLPGLKNAKTVGVGFSFQLFPTVPYEAHDVILDRVLTSDVIK